MEFFEFSISFVIILINSRALPLQDSASTVRNFVSGEIVFILEHSNSAPQPVRITFSSALSLDLASSFMIVSAEASI